MSVYDKNGNALASVYDKNGNALASVYDKNGNNIFGGDVPVDRTKSAYDYYTDPDPNKSYTWNYSLPELKALQNGHFTIGVQTDTHLLVGADSAECNPLKNMTKQLYFDFICNLGDIPRGYASDTVEATKSGIEDLMERYTDYVESPFIAVIGNHDNANMASGYISKADMRDYYITNNSSLSGISNPTDELYYYKDIAECRVIVLDTTNYPYLTKSSTDINISHATISESQLNWFINYALNTDKPVIVLSHHPLVTAIRPSYLVDPSTDTADDHMIPYRATQLVAALNSFKNNGGTVVACLSGHMHAQEDAVVDGINFIGFANGGRFAELLFIDLQNRTIATKVINNSNISNRTFTF